MASLTKEQRNNIWNKLLATKYEDLSDTTTHEPTLRLIATIDEMRNRNKLQYMIRG
jgi:hypothetical protein